jgi:2,3,4,5-tetrahydropyridine-2-carboxylate N-succinyltransferase
MSEIEWQKVVNAAWEDRTSLMTTEAKLIRDVVLQTLAALDKGHLRVAEKIGDCWYTHQWLKKAILLSFQLWEPERICGAPGSTSWWDRVTLKFAGWEQPEFQEAGFRAVPGCIVRHSAYIAPGVVLMPCFINVGAYVGENSMIDTWATVGSCAQIGRNVHVSGGAGIGGVLEPLQTNPVIIEDDCFIGARSEVAEGVIIERGAVLSMGVFLGASTKIVDRDTGELFLGRVPAWSVVVPGVLPGRLLQNGDPGPGLSCAVIIKRVDAKTRAKVAINELLRGIEL